MEYGRARSPQIESKKAMPLSSYGKAKFMATKHILNLFFEYKFPGVILRPYQVYGPNQDTKRLIPYVIKSCLHNKKFNCSGGKQYRDFLYVSDFIKAIYNSLKSNRTSGQVINVGFGKPYNIKKTIYFINCNEGHIMKYQQHLSMNIRYHILFIVSFRIFKDMNEQHKEPI